MSKEMTKTEQKLWFEVLQGEKTGFKFVKQKVLFNYIVDFYCSSLLLAVEVDGESHAQNLEYDKVRDQYLQTAGIKTLRYSSEEVLNNLENIKNKLVSEIKLRTEELQKKSPYLGGVDEVDGGHLGVILVDAIDCLVVKDGEKLKLNLEIFEYLKNRTEQKIVVTNAKDEVFKQLQELLKNTDFEIFSLAFEPEKTDPKYYQILVEKYDLELKNVIYFDHSQANLNSAKKVEIEGILYENNQQIISDLEKSANTGVFTTEGKKQNFSRSNLEDYYLPYLRYFARINHGKIWPQSIVASLGKSTQKQIFDLVQNLLTRDLIIATNLDKDEYVATNNFLNYNLFSLITNAGSFTAEQTDQIIEFYKLKSPEGNPLSKAKKFNLLVKTHLGPVEDEASVAYLKGESCANIYIDYKATQEVTRKKIPFGIAQQGKAFRNEITVKQFLFRMREFEQADVEFFVQPTWVCEKLGISETPDYWYDHWKNHVWDFYTKGLGLDEKNLRWRQHDPEERVFYATDAWDIQYNFGEMGWQEIAGLHHRGSYDLDQHSKFSGKDLSYFDPELAEKFKDDASVEKRYNPWVIESSLGCSRMFLAVLFESLKNEEIKNEEKSEIRTVLQLPANLAPFKIAILPLMKKDGLKEKAEEIYLNLKKQGISCDFDDAGSIGKRYRRQDENGTPNCVCVDYQTLEDDTITVRNRDTMEQVRVKISELSNLV